MSSTLTTQNNKEKLFKIIHRKDLSKYLKIQIIHKEENFEKHKLESTNSSRKIT